MKHISRTIALLVLTVTISCAGAKEVPTTNSSNTKNSAYPAWYSGFEFNADSSLFTSRATAVADDSETAEVRAENEARVLLESYIAEELEDIRTELERDGSSTVQEANFILMLRNAHLAIEDAATITNTESIQKEGVYRGFVKVEITKGKINSLLEKGFSSNSSYWREFSGARSYQDFIK